MFGDLPERYEHRYRYLQLLRDEFNQHLARAYLPALRGQIAQVSTMSERDRRALAYAVQTSLEGLGLQPVCPATNRPASLAPSGPSETTPDGEPSHFQFHTSSLGATERVHHSSQWATMPEFKVIAPAPFQPEKLSTMFADIHKRQSGRGGGGGGRGR